MPHVLVIDDQVATLSEGLRLALRGHTLRFVPDGRQALAALEADPKIMAALLDIAMPAQLGDDPESEGFAVLDAIREARPDLPVIMLTTHSAPERVVEAMRRGAFHYVAKPPDAAHLRAIVAQALEAAAERRSASAEPSADVSPIPGVIAADPKSREVFDQVRRCASLRGPVLIHGETGTGKEVIARALHRLSGRSGAFIPINCAAIPATMLESELFGHRRGAFTGADRDQTGKIALADGGTLFLDEIGDMPPPLQAKILRVLEDRTVMPLGAGQGTSVDFRLICATHRDLPTLIREGQFREDLHYRINVFPIRLAPLRERPGDVEPLAKALLRDMREDFGQDPPPVTPEALERLRRHQWPGNVRELRTALARAWAHSGGEPIAERHLALDAGPMLSADRDASALWAEIDRGDRRLADLTAFRNRHGEKTLREVLAMALRESGGVKAAGQRIGYIADDDDRAAYDNFRQWMRKLGLSAKRVREEAMNA